MNILLFVGAVAGAVGFSSIALGTSCHSLCNQYCIIVSMFRISAFRDDQL
jgi:hypothetical protein